MRKRSGRESRRKRWQKLIEQGENFSKKEILFCYGLVMLSNILLGLGMQLQWQYVLVGTIVCFFQVPGLYFHYKKSAYERKRFDEVNAYLSHMAQAFVGNGKILQALKETRKVFPGGNMYKLILQASNYIEAAYDVELAEQEALAMIAEEYECERVHTLHDFLLKAESRGGSCEAEFKLLESIRQLWEKNTLKYRNTLSMARNLVVFEYLLLVLVCIFMLYQFPEELSIIHLPLIQGLNTFLIAGFFFVFCRMDKKLGISLLKDRKRMNQRQAEKRLNYVENFYGKSALLRQLPFALAELVFVLILYGWGRNKLWLIFGLLVFLVILVWKYGKYFLTVYSIKAEVKAVFPEWLFDVLLLMQSENVTVALFKSIERAPEILKRDLKEMKAELEEQPLSSDAFLSFLAEFQIPEVENTMRKLYALNLGKGAKAEVMNLIIDNNLTMLAEADTQRLRLKGDMLSFYYMLPTIPVMICMLGYGVALMITIFKNVMTVI